MGDGMKLITFMRMLVDYEKIGYEITSNREVIVVYGEKGKLVIPFADIYSWKTGELRRKIRELKPKQKSDGDNLLIVHEHSHKGYKLHAVTQFGACALIVFLKGIRTPSPSTSSPNDKSAGPSPLWAIDTDVSEPVSALATLAKSPR